MSLSEYLTQFQELVAGELVGNFTSHVAAEVAAGYEIGLTLEQMRRFLARRTEITSVAVALKRSTLPAETIERILEARRSGAIYPKEILSRAFSKEEVHQKFHAEVFGASDA